MENQISIKKIFEDLFSFVKRPTDTQLNISFKNRVKLLTALFCFELAITIFVVFPLYFLIDLILPLQFKSNYFIQETLLSSFLLSVLFVPFLEELLFRLFLKQSRWGRIFRRRKVWNKVFPFLTYLSCILFGALHLLNFKNNTFLFYLLGPLIVLSQLTGGIILAFIRVRITFLYGFLFHAFWNFIVAILIPLTLSAFTYPFIDNNKRYSLRIQEQPFFENKKPKSIEIDRNNGSIFKINTQQYPLQAILDSLYGNEVYYVEDVLVNMTLNSPKGISIAEFKNILAKEYSIE